MTLDPHPTTAADASPGVEAEVVAEAVGVAVRYGRRRVLEDVSFAVPRGAVFALLGRNGSGKSSLVRCLVGLQQASGGRLKVFGHDPWRHRVAVLHRTGVVPETPDAPADMTAARLVRFCGRLHARWDAAGVLARLARFDVPLDVPFGRLSRGQRGGVMLALAFGHAPDLLVLDDPTLGLDAVARSATFTELIAELADRGATVFLTTHDLAGIEGLATHVALLHEGRIAAAGELESLKAGRGESLEQLFIRITTQPPPPGGRFVTPAPEARP
jgi:ABC-2 type transport system ATP-binding protein